MDLWYIDHWSLWLDMKIVFLRSASSFAASRSRSRTGSASSGRKPPTSEGGSGREWDELLERLGCGDAYLLRAYVEASCVLDPGEPVLLEDDGVVMACIVREIPGTDAHDVSTPYGYGGPVGNGDFHQAYERWCAEREVVSTFIRYHPLFENYRGAPHASYASPTVGWRLEGDLLAGMHGKHRNVVRKAQKAGVRVETATGGGGFDSLYEATMERQQAAAYYFFPDAYWACLTELGNRLVRFDAIAESEVVASAL